MFAVLANARKAIALFFALTALVILAACEPVSLGGIGGGGPSINTSAPVPVALLVPRGGGNSGDDLLAQSLENAARLAISDLEGASIDLRVYSTGGSPAQAQAQALQAVSDGAKIILGPVYGEEANAVAVAVAPKGINVLSFSNNTTIAGGNLFILGPTFQNTANRLVSYAARHGKDRIVIAHDSTVAGQLGRNAIQNAIGRSGATLAGTVSYDFSQQGVVSAIPEIRSAVSSGGANALFLTANTAGAMPLFSQLLPEAGVRPETTQYIGLTRWDIPAQTLELPGVQGGWFAMPDPTMTARFSSRYNTAFSGQPHPIGGLAYDGIAAIGALVKAGKRDALTASALTQGAGFQGVNGILRLRSDGTNERGLAVAQIRDKQVVIIDQAPRSFDGLGF
ncbi:penicillin-binding protein activator [Thalassovita taeanensis]|uniref:Amino acid/amide ABC transporter substrate-binding protein, HAAT family n=1 Tax=Thalassovita taeanensis TaxID=657014 RepID=A0A1H9DEB5_9RHOB|nr:penicillin-binding protein activator [Thalassovita taeanensis]SEQ11721.1 amino acid/amide ABC transporter substrate-binding protein, HAAT family [Thalassovita taeanensis]